MKGKRVLAFTLAAVAAVALVVLILWLVVSRGGGGGGEKASVVVECELGKPAAMRILGQEHEVVLLEVDGSSARFAFSSPSPQEVTLTVGLPADIDLDADAVPDAEATLATLTPDGARLELSPLAYLAWDEAGFVTQGGCRPYMHHDNYGDEDFSVVNEGDSYLLLYVSGDGKLNWERYDAKGDPITAPGLQAGVIEQDKGAGRVSAVDGELVGDWVTVAVKDKRGVSLRSYDHDFFHPGQPLFIGSKMNNPVIVAGGDHPFVVTEGDFDAPRTGGKKPRIIVTEVDLAGSPSILRQEAVTGLEADDEKHVLCDAAFDKKTGRLIVLYRRFFTASNESDLQLVAVDRQTLAPAWTATLDPRERFRGKRGCLAASGGEAVVVWYSGYRSSTEPNLFVSSVDMNGGGISEVWSGRVRQSAPRYPLGTYPCELVPTIAGSGRRAFAYYDASAKRGVSTNPSPGHGRFVLWPWEDGSWAAGPLVLDGGKPILCDPLIELNSFSQMPRPAICGAPLALKGKVVNRGSSRADAVTVTATLAGEAIGSAELGRIKAASSAEYTIIWEVPADYAGETAEITFTLSTSSKQYTTGNDAAAHAFAVRQKGQVSGRVSDCSSDVRHRIGWYPGLANARVTVAGQTVLTNEAGTFTLDGLEFGTHQVVVECEGYNRVETQVTVSRTRPLAFVSANLDNHGLITLRVEDEGGNPLQGVDVYLHEYEEKESTPASGELTWDISARTYTFSFVKQGYHAVGGQEVEVALGEEREQTVTMQAIDTGTLAGRVVDRRGVPIGGSTVTIKDQTGTVVAQPQVDGGGGFAPVELSAKPAKTYEVTVSGGGMTATETIKLYGGDELFRTFWLVPDAGQRRVRTATQGYTSWMVKAGWPGLGPVSGADMYVWYGNYAICVGAEYWSGNQDLAAVDVTVWGGNYEAHATKSEVDFSGWFEPEDTGSVFDITKWAEIPSTLIKDHSADVLDVIGDIIDGFKGDVDKSVETGQGSELITWKEARSDFAPQLEFDSSDPLSSLWDVVDAVPRSFAIPVVIGGSSEEQTAVRVDGVDVVRLGSGAPVGLSGPGQEWSSFQGPEGTENNNGKRYEVTQEGVPYDEVIVYVWLTVQKYWNGTPGGTCFSQRQQQVVVFNPGPQKMKGYIAPGSLYGDPQQMAH